MRNRPGLGKSTRACARSGVLAVYGPFVGILLLESALAWGVVGKTRSSFRPRFDIVRQFADAAHGAARGILAGTTSMFAQGVVDDIRIAEVRGSSWRFRFWL
jgi:hypothetical protein